MGRHRLADVEGRSLRSLFAGRNRRDDLMSRSFRDCRGCGADVYVLAEDCRDCGEQVELRAS